MDHRTVERTLFLLIWLVEAGVSSKKEDAFSKETGSWKSRPTVAYYENNDTTTTQQQPDQRMTTTVQILDNSTEVAMVTDNSSTSNETTTPSTIMTMSTNSTEDVFASTPSSAAAAANSSSSDAAPNMLASNVSEVSSVNNTLPFSASNALNHSDDNASENFNFLASTSLTNATTVANIPNSAAAEPDSNATYAVTNSPNLNNATTFGTDGYNWSTTQGGGGGGDGGNSNVATGAQESVRADQADQEGSWNSTTTPPSSDTNNSNSTVQSETDREVNTTAAQALGTNSTASAMPAMPAENSTATSAGPVVNNDILPFSASNALNPSNDNASENFNFLTGTSFTNASTTANIPNSATAEPDSNATNAVVTNSPNLNNATTFGTDSYNWNTTQGGGRGGGDGGNVTTGVLVALGAENPFPDDPGSWNSTITTTTIYDSQGNTTQPPGEALPAVPTDINAANNTAATTANSTSATPAPNSTANTFPSAPSSANSSEPAPDFPDDNALQSTYTTSYFIDANITTVNSSSNSLKPDLVSNTTVNASEGEMNGTDFGNDGYNWTSVTTQSSGGVGGGGGGGNWSNSSVSTNSNSTEGNQTENMTTASYYKTIHCYNCSGDNCSKTDDSNNNTATCVSSTGTCYMQYDAVATALSYSCSPLLSGGGNGCPSAYATRVEKTVCEMCCTASLCNSKAPSEMEQMCHHQLRSSVDQIGGGGGVFQLVVAALIAAIHYCSFATASFGDW